MGDLHVHGVYRVIESASAFPESHDRRVVEVFLGNAFDVTVGFTSSGGGRQRNAKLVGEVQREAEILVHEPQRKAGDVFTFEEIGAFTSRTPERAMLDCRTSTSFSP